MEHYVLSILHIDEAMLCNTCPNQWNTNEQIEQISLIFKGVTVLRIKQLNRNLIWSGNSHKFMYKSNKYGQLQQLIRFTPNWK